MAKSSLYVPSIVPFIDYNEQCGFEFFYLKPLLGSAAKVTELWNDDTDPGELKKAVEHFAAERDRLSGLLRWKQ